MIKHYGNLDLRNCDCMDLMKTYPDNHFELAIVDPPYGIDITLNGYCHSKSRKVRQKNGKITNLKTPHKNLFDDKKPEPEYFIELFRVSRNQIIWGGNHLSTLINKDNSGWICWDKINGESSFSDIELAYSSFDTGARLIRYMWSGFLQGSSKNWEIAEGNKAIQEKRIHPTQKPVILYKWLLENYAKPGDKILDTHLGAGSIAIACYYMNFDLVASEKNIDCYNDMMNRIESETKQQELF